MHMKIKSKIKKIVVNAFITFFRLNTLSRWSIEVREVLQSLNGVVRFNGSSIFFNVTNNILKFRVDTFHNKEPETLKWISSLKDDSVFYDVGANIGLYSIAAALKVKNVYAFEPVYYNYYNLNKNIISNHLQHRIKAFCFALSNSMSFGQITLSDLSDGAALHSFHNQEKESKDDFHQPCLSFSLDELVYQYNFPCPNYLKIDVDGLEHKIIEGAQKLLKDNRLKEILIEIDESNVLDRNLLNILLTEKFIIDENLKSIETGPVKNYIFKREYTDR